MWVEAPVPSLPQLPIEEHGKLSRSSLFIYNTGSSYSCGKEPACGRLKQLEKSNMQAPVLLVARSDGEREREQGPKSDHPGDFGSPPSSYLTALAKKG